MVTHTLKVRAEWAERVRAGQKTAEVRRHDRDFQVGDGLCLVPVGPDGTEVEEDAIVATITHVLPYAAFPDGLVPGYCVLSIRLEEVDRG